MNRILRFIKYLLTRKQYAKYHYSVVIRHPLLINGKRGIIFGKNVFIRDNARIECLIKENEKASLYIGNRVSIEQDLHLICGKSVYIGDDCVFSARVFISDVNHQYIDINKNVLQQDLDVKTVKIDDGTFLGYGVVVLPGVHLGKHCIVGANSVVTKSFPDYCVIAGNPARLIKKYNAETKSWEKVE